MTTFTVVGILLAHLVGDYLLQTDWMAQEKTKRWMPAVVHAITYGVPFLVVTMSPWTLLVIVATHAVLDRYRLARHVVWAKNQIGPKRYRYAWDGGNSTGYRSDVPVWLAGWLVIVADNTIHLLINYAAVYWLG